MRAPHCLAAAATSLAFVATTLTAAAQTTASAQPSPARPDSLATPHALKTPSPQAIQASPRDEPDSSRYVPQILTNRSLATLGIATVVVTAAFTPFDAAITRKAQEARGAGTGPVEHVANTLNWIGDPGSAIIPVLLLGTGWVSGNGTMREIGLHSAESIVLTGGATALIKGMTGRRRPGIGTQDMDDFTFAGGFRGGNGSESFPSGHTTAAFALATTLTLETMRFHPDATTWVALSSYSVATGVGMARVYTNHHWASDVALGAGIGTLGALMVERYAHGGMVRHRTLASVLPSTVSVGTNGHPTLGWTIPFSK